MSKTTQQRPQLAENVVIDTDVHLVYDGIRGEVASRMEQPYRSFTDPESGSDSVAYPSEGLGADLGGHKEVMIGATSDPETIYTELCEDFHVDYPVISSFVPSDRIYRTRRAIEETRAANDVLLDDFLDEYDEFYGFATVPARDPHAAAEEIDRLADEEKIVGIYIEIGAEFQPKPLGDPIYDVMYEAMEDAGLPPAYHIIYYPMPAVSLRRAETKFTQVSVGPIWCTMLTITSLIAQGVPEKFPDLDFLFLEQGLTIIPHLMARLNRRYAEFRSELPLLEKMPEEYIRDQFYFATQPLGEFMDPSHMDHVIEMIGPDSITFSSDYPHYDFDHPSALDGFLQRFSEEEREQVLHGNAAEVLGIDV